MSDDVLSRATRALREETAGDDASARFTRSRIMASVTDERVKRRTRWAFLLPIAATFVAASAYGAATGKTHEALLAVVHALGIHRSEPPPAPRVSHGPAPSAAVAPVAEAMPPAPPPAPPDTAAPPPVVEAPSPVEPPALAAALPPHPKAPRSPAPDSAALAPSPRPSASAEGTHAADPTLDLYRTAHQAHFVDRDYGRALAGWNAYLKAAPAGTLAPEARYNRALCLVRLGRADEARAALTPFATGQYGTYRREDAQKLIDALPPALVGP
jgi:hypothetical protein